MSRFLFHRILQAIPVLLVIITLTFFMVRLAPGDPFTQERQVSEQVRQRMQAHYGLDRPLLEQYFRYLGNLLRGDLGPSFKQEGRTVQELIGEAFPVSLELGLWALAFSLAVGVPFGMLAALKRNSWLDYVPMSFAMIGICLPTFVVGPLLQLFVALKMGPWINETVGILLPVSGWSFWGSADFRWEHRVLPALTLGLAHAAYVARLTRGGMLEILSADFIRTARAKGVPEHLVVLRHALRGGLAPVLAYLGPALAGLLSGAFITELVFQIPGLGRHFINAALNRDYSMILGTVIFFATLIVLANLLVDVVQVLLNPRLRFD